MITWHKSLEGRFASFPVHQQILMVCNGLNRAENLRNDPPEYKRCLERSLELLDYFMRDKKKHLLRESLRIRELIAEAYISTPRSIKRIQTVLLQINPTAWCMLNKK